MCLIAYDDNIAPICRTITEYAFPDHRRRMSKSNGKPSWRVRDLTHEKIAWIVMAIWFSWKITTQGIRLQFAFEQLKNAKWDCAHLPISYGFACIVVKIMHQSGHRFLLSCRGSTTYSIGD